MIRVWLCPLCRGKFCAKPGTAVRVGAVSTMMECDITKYGIDGLKEFLDVKFL